MAVSLTGATPLHAQPGAALLHMASVKTASHFH